MLELRDPVSSASHLLTAVWAVFATLVMWRMAANRPARLWPVAIYGASMVLLYVASGTFHGLHYDTPEQKRFFQKLDQTAIYLLIAGTYTPIVTIVLRGAWRTWLLAMMWTMAFAGIACLWVLPKAPYAVVVSLYLAMGWLGFLPLPVYYRAMGWRAMNWVWIGAGFYSFGAICELTQWPVIVPGWFQAHEVLHVADVGGTMAFFVLITRYVLPRPPGTAVRPERVAAEVAARRGPSHDGF